MKTISNKCKHSKASPITDEQQQEPGALKATKGAALDAKHECDFDDTHSSYKKPSRAQKERIYTSVDKDLLDWLKQPGKGYQTRLNAVLRWARSNGCPITLL